jgi:hypothetical protein
MVRSEIERLLAKEPFKLTKEGSERVSAPQGPAVGSNATK